MCSGPMLQCMEGYYTKTCTTTAPTEGYHTFKAVGVDDDLELRLKHSLIFYLLLHPPAQSSIYTRTEALLRPMNSKSGGR